MEARVVLLAILVVAVLGRANSVAVAAGVLLLAQLLQADAYLYPLLEKRGMEWGLVLLIGAILVPIARGDIDLKAITRVFASWLGILAFSLSLFTTYLSGQGLQFLTTPGQAGIMPALILGAVVAAALLKGVPVGPLITAGLLAVVLRFWPH